MYAEEPQVLSHDTADTCGTEMHLLVLDSVLMQCRGTYHNLVANAARLAGTESDVETIPRIAAGEPVEVAEGELTKDQEAGIVTAGLQGYVDKPRQAVG